MKIICVLLLARQNIAITLYINDFYARMETDVSFVCSTTLIYKSQVLYKNDEKSTMKNKQFHPYAN